MGKPNNRYFRHRRGVIKLTGRARLMGIVNVTPDSFSDGGRYLDPARAVEHALELVEEGAELLDIGAESTRPGSRAVSTEEQTDRLLPVLEALRSETDAVISIDTQLADVARPCLRSGADLINDVSGLSRDETLADVCREYEAGLVLMHMRGTPDTMQRDVAYENVVLDVRDVLQNAVARASRHGMQLDAILVDPGLGFGKSFEQNYLLMRELELFRDLATGVLVGPSRKAFTGEFSGLPASERQYSTAAAVAICVLRGADFLRVHDVAAMKQVIDMCNRYCELSDVSG